MKYAPRLTSVKKRIQRTTRIPLVLRNEIKHVANMHRCSESWIVEQIILDWAGIDVEYRTNGHKKGRK